MPAEKQTGYNDLVAAPSTALTAATSVTVYVPLQFWFCRNVGLALPLIALQYHEVKVNIEFAAASEMGLTTAPTGLTAELWADYIYLDVEERKRFAQVSHEYLIDQLQFVGADSVSGGSVNSKLNFNHPVKELVWITKDDGVLVNQSASSVSLKLNGHDRFAARPGKYFSMVQPYQHHTCVPVVASGINVYSFALKPEEHQPSGTCNFSRIDNASLILTGLASGTTELKVFATNYNILRILSGMGGIAYSN
jgi:Large eukaryotic DNA virus major capsid protein/Major capsid protein N-terminus